MTRSRSSSTSSLDSVAKCAVSVCLVLLVPLVSARSEDWTKYRHDLSNSGASGENTISSSNAASLKVKWKFNSGSTISGSPAVVTVNGTSVVFVGSWNGNFYAVNAVTGQQIWSFKVDNTPYCSPCLIASSPAVANGIVYFGADNGFVYALNAATGALVWKVQLGDPTQGYAVWSSPAVYNSVVYVGLASHGDAPCVVGHVFALNASTGATVWNFQTLDESSCPGGSNCVGAGVWASPVIDTQNGVLYVGTGNPGSTCSPSTPNATRYPDSILSLSLTNGQLVSYFQAISNDNSDDDFGSSPFLYSTDLVEKNCNGVTLTQTSLWVAEASKNGSVYQCNRARGTLGGCSSKALDGSTIVASPALTPPGSNYAPYTLITCQNGGTRKYDGVYIYPPTYAGNLWQVEAINAHLAVPIKLAAVTTLSINSAPALEQDMLFFGADNSIFYGYEIGGTLIFEFQTSGAIYSGPAISNSRIYFGSSDGNLYCLSVNGQ